MTSIDSEYTINENKGDVYKPDKYSFQNWSMRFQ